MRLKILISSLLTVVVIMFSCTKKESITSGLITYSIAYPDFDKEKNKLTYMFLPKEQLYYFKDSLVHSQIKKMVVEINLFTNNASEELTTDLLYNEKTYTKLMSSDKALLLNNNKDYKIKNLKGTEVIAGFKCKLAEVTLPDGTKSEIAYTDEINVYNANWFNPFSEIDGTLLRYTLIQHGMKMEFEAKSYSKLLDKNIDLSSPEKGKEVTYTAFESKLDEMFEEFLK